MKENKEYLEVTVDALKASERMRKASYRSCACNHVSETVGNDNR